MTSCHDEPQDGAEVKPFPFGQLWRMCVLLVMGQPRVIGERCGPMLRSVWGGRCCGPSAVVGTSGRSDAPAGGTELQTERGETREVERPGARVDVGADAAKSARARSSSAPGSEGEVRDLALDHRSVGPITRLPRRVGLFGASPLKKAFVRMDRDRAARA